MSFLSVYAGRTFGIPHSVIIAVFIVILAEFFSQHTPFGREVRAIGGGERVALLTGIKVDRVKISMYVTAGLLTGLAGVLQAARVYAATPRLGDGLELQVISAVVLGGTPLTGGAGGVKGTIIGALIISVLSNGMNMMGLSPYIQNIVQGFVLVGAVFATIDRGKIGIIK
jgi:ribose transport system permease protein